MAGLKRYTHHGIQQITNNFINDNFIGDFQFGKLYRGMDYGIALTIKTLEPNQHYEPKPGDNETRFRDELDLLTKFYHMPSHGCLPQLAGYCRQPGHLAIVYRLNALNTLNNILSEDSFHWRDRIKIAFGCASVLEFMHQIHPAFPYLIRNVDPAHILVDEDYNPILYEFGMTTGGMITDRTHLQAPHVFGCYRSSHRSFFQGAWTDKCDVFAYGCMLLGLIMARTCDYEDGRDEVSLLHERRQRDLPSQNSEGAISLVRKTLEAGPLFYDIDAVKISELALRCTDINPKRRPSMKQVVECLQKLQAIMLHARELEIDEMINDHDHYIKAKKTRRYYPECRPLQKEKNNNDLHPKCCFMKPHDFHLVKGGQHVEIKVLSAEDLSVSTNGFSEANIIGNFQYGKLYHGNIDGRKVTVKIWKDDYSYVLMRDTILRRLHEARQRDELDLLQHPKIFAQPNAVRVIGYCHEEECLGMAYDVDSLDSMSNLILKDSFTWLQRIKAIVGFACFLEFLHAPHPPHYSSYLILNIDADHVMVDQDYNPKLIDFGMITGGIFPDRTQELRGRGNSLGRGYLYDTLFNEGPWDEKCDVFAFGILLFRTITKSGNSEEERRAKSKNSGTPFFGDNDWGILKSEYKRKMLDLGANKNDVSFVHQSLEADKDLCSEDGVGITRLLLKCVEYFEDIDSLCMKQVVNELLGLRVVQLHAHEIGIAQMINECNRVYHDP